MTDSSPHSEQENNTDGGCQQAKQSEFPGAGAAPVDPRGSERAIEHTSGDQSDADEREQDAS